MVKVKRSTWELQDRSVDTSCCLLSLRINLITSGLQLILSKGLSLLIPIKKVARNLVYGRLPSWREEKEWGEVIPQYVAHLVLFRHWCWKTRMWKARRGKNSPVFILVRKKSSFEIWKVWTGTPLARELRTHSVIDLGACYLFLPLNSPLLLLFFLFFSLSRFITPPVSANYSDTAPSSLINYLWKFQTI